VRISLFPLNGTEQALPRTDADQSGEETGRTSFSSPFRI